MASWARIDVLVLDDLGPQPLTPAQAADLQTAPDSTDPPRDHR